MTFKILIILLFLASCGSMKTNKQVQATKKPLSPREKALQYYRNLRQKEWNNITKKKDKLRSKFLRIRPKRKKLSNTPRYTKPIPKKVKPIKMVNVQEQSIEIEQNMAFYCMKNRKNVKFSNENDCYAFTQNINIECLDNFVRGDARLTKCVKSRLK